MYPLSIQKHTKQLKRKEDQGKRRKQNSKSIILKKLLIKPNLTTTNEITKLNKDGKIFNKSCYFYTLTRSSLSYISYPIAMLASSYIDRHLTYNGVRRFTSKYVLRCTQLEHGQRPQPRVKLHQRLGPQRPRRFDNIQVQHLGRVAQKLELYHRLIT